jgi:hypothetical protein
MSNLLTSPILFLILGLILILVIIHDLLRSTLHFTHRLLKFEYPQGHSLRIIAILQVLVGILVTIVLRLVHNDPVLDLGIGAGLMLLSGIPFIKLFLKYPWKITLLVWVVAFIMQAVVVPVVSLVTVALFILLASLLFPPQY